MRRWIQFDPAQDFGSHQQTKATMRQAGDESYYVKGPLPRRQADGDSYYLISYVKDSQGHPFTVLFHFFIVYQEALERLGLDQGFAQVAVSMLDEADSSGDGYISQAHQLTPEQIGRAEKMPSNSQELDIQTPLGTLQGTIDSVRLQAAIARGDQALPGKHDGEEWKIDLTMKNSGLPLPYLGSGIIPFDKEIDYEYALPNTVTSGTLSVGRNTYEVNGSSWFDREWGHFGPCKWTWMAIELSNQVQIALWDQQDNNDHPDQFAEGRSAFATMLEPLGSIAVASVEVQEEESFESPRSHQHYPRQWSVSVPSKQIELRVHLLRNDQEIIPQEEINSGKMRTPRLEGKASVQGTCEGQKVEGSAFVELFNLFPAFTAPRAAESRAASTGKNS